MSLAVFKSKGFTILELLIVLSLLAVLVLTGWNSFSSSLGRVRLRYASLLLLQDLRHLQIRAMVSSGLREVIFSSRDNTSYLIQVKSNPKLFKKVSLPSGVVIRFYSIVRGREPAYRFGFQPTGAPTASGSITLESIRGNRVILILMPSTGRMRLER